MKRRLPSVAAVWFLATFFLLAGIAALLVGAHDVTVSGGRFGVLFPAVLLVLAGALFVGAARQLSPIAMRRRTSNGD